MEAAQGNQGAALGVGERGGRRGGGHKGRRGRQKGGGGGGLGFGPPFMAGLLPSTYGPNAHGPEALAQVVQKPR